MKAGLLEVSEDAEVELDGEHYLLEAGDKVRVLTEGAILRKVLKVSFGDEDKYYIASSASDNWLINFVRRLCAKIKTPYQVTITHKVPSGQRAKSIRSFLDELVPPIEEPKPN